MWKERTAFLLVALIVLSMSACKVGLNDCNGSCGKIYVANEGNQSITVIDASDYEVLKFIRVNLDGDMVMVHNIQASPDGNSVWATFNGMETDVSGFLTIDPRTDEITHEVILGNGWNVAHVVFDSAALFAYIVATDSNMIAEISTTSLTCTRKFHIGADHSPHGLRYSGGSLYVANMTGRSMSVIDVASGAVNDIPTGGLAVQTAIVPGRYAFASLYDTKKIFSYDLISGDTDSYFLPSGAQGPVQIYPFGSDKLLICDQGMLLGRPSSDQLYVMDVETGEILSAITVGDGTHGIVADPNSRRAYCTNREDNSVTVVDITGAKVVCTIPVGIDPNGITFWSETGGQP